MNYLFLRGRYKNTTINQINKIATALAFSPRAKDLLLEAKRISQTLSAELILIHAGEKNHELEEKLDELLSFANLSSANVKVVWENGRPLEVLSRISKKENVDLLILGAIQHETMLTYYMGSLARKISRNPPCSLLLVTNPSAKAQKLNSVIVNGVDHHKTAHTLAFALEFSQKYKVNELIVVEEVSPTKVKTRIDDYKSMTEALREKNALKRKEDMRIRALIDKLPESKDLNIKMECIFGKKGYSIGHYTEVKKADLLVMNSPDFKFGFLERLFPHDLEYILSDMPSNLMIVQN